MSGAATKVESETDESGESIARECEVVAINGSSPTPKSVAEKPAPAAE
jgi:hypothetical protein